MKQLMNLITELVKKGITFTVRPLGEQIEVTAFYVMDNMEVIQHPVLLDDTVDHTVYFIKGEDESNDGILYKWTFGQNPAGCWNWE